MNKTKIERILIMSNKKNSLFLKYGFSIVEIVLYTLSLAFIVAFYSNAKEPELYTSLVFLISGTVILLVDLIFCRVYKFYCIKQNKKEYTYKKLRFAEDTTISKNKSYTQYVFNKKETTVENKKIFFIIKGVIMKNNMIGREIKDFRKIDKLVIPYFLGSCVFPKNEK